MGPLECPELTNDLISRYQTQMELRDFKIEGSIFLYPTYHELSPCPNKPNP